MDAARCRMTLGAVVYCVDRKASGAAARASVEKVGARGCLYLDARNGESHSKGRYKLGGLDVDRYEDFGPLATGCNDVAEVKGGRCRSFSVGHRRLG